MTSVSLSGVADPFTRQRTFVTVTSSWTSLCSSVLSGMIPKQCKIRSKPQHTCKKLALYSFLERSLAISRKLYKASFLEITMRVQDRACVRMQKAAYAG